MQNLLRQQRPHEGQSDPGPVGSETLLSTTDASCGRSNLATRPRAGNISSDTRAGRIRRLGPWTCVRRTRPGASIHSDPTHA
jgi:hypothetical protein